MKKTAPIIICIAIVIGAGVIFAKTELSSKYQLFFQKDAPADKKENVNKLLEEDESAENEDQPTAEEIAHGEVYLDDVKVSIKSTGFSPDPVSIKKGTTILWTNDDTAKHQISVTGGAQTIPITPKKSGQIIFNKVGSYTYEDTLHPGLKGTVIVQ